MFDVLDTSSKAEGDEAWLLLRQELADVGIASELATQNHDSIILSLRRIIKPHGLLPGTEQSAPVEKSLSLQCRPQNESTD